MPAIRNFLFCLLAWLLLAPAARAGSVASVPVPAAAGGEDVSPITPSWETQKQARLYLLDLPAPRGQITDRNGRPLAQTRVSYNLAIQFSPPFDRPDAQVLEFARQQAALAGRLLRRKITLDEKATLDHYRNRAIIPMEIVQDVPPADLAVLRDQLPPGLTLRPVYLRFYPNGPLAGQVLGYVGRMGNAATGPISNGDLLWPEFEGREGLEQTFNEQLSGKFGQLNTSFDEVGNKISEKVSIPPEAGYNVITTLDEDIQRLAEKILSENAERGAIVVLDPNNGDILCLASWPTINPNAFIPYVSSETFKALQDDPDVPLLPRAYRSAYPAGSIFKIFTGIAALESGHITTNSEYDCPAVFELGNLEFRNWKKSGAGSLNFVDALTQSCNTWFYQCALDTGKEAIIDWSNRFDLGKKSGIPLRSEATGRIPTDEYMMKVYKRPIMQGDVCNMAIGQGDILVTPLQMAQAMMAVGNGGIIYQPRLVGQVQHMKNEIITAYEIRAKEKLGISDDTIEAVHKGMVRVVNSGSGTAAKARVKGVSVAGKTGTAQWGPKHRERTAAWFIGFAPAKKPKYAFAALYEGDADDDDVHGGTNAAPMIGKLLRELFKNDFGKEAGDEAAPGDEAPDEEAPTDESN